MTVLGTSCRAPRPVSGFLAAIFNLDDPLFWSVVDPESVAGSGRFGAWVNRGS